LGLGSYESLQELQMGEALLFRRTEHFVELFGGQGHA